jgi:predicted HicB family RNase H-like nuclease
MASGDVTTFNMRIDRALKAAAEKAAHEDGRSLANLIAKLLRDYLKKRRDNR